MMFNFVLTTTADLKVQKMSLVFFSAPVKTKIAKTRSVSLNHKFVQYSARKKRTENTIKIQTVSFKSLDLKRL